MGTNDFNEEITVVTRPVSMVDMIEGDTIEQVINECLALLDTPTTVNDSFPFLAEPTHITRFPAIFK